MSLPDAPSSLADRQVFTTNGVVFTVADIARRAVVGGRESVLGVSTAGQAEEMFRRARGLLTADALDSWLAGWSIEPDDFRRWTEDAVAGTTTATSWCRMLCSGRYDATAAALAAAAAAACELGEPPSDTAFEAADWTERLLARRTTPEALGARIDAHRLEWTRVDVVLATTPRRAVAEELRHQVLTDGLDLAGAGTRAGIPTAEVAEVLADYRPQELRAALTGVRVGELVGPLAIGDGWALVSVRERTEPALNDPAIHARARAVLHHEVITAAVARHVVA